MRRIVDPPMATDSGTMRNVFSSTLLELAAPVAAESRFGSPLAAAAQERSVDRLALNAASWSAWYDGEIMLYGVCCRERWVGYECLWEAVPGAVVRGVGKYEPDDAACGGWQADDGGCEKAFGCGVKTVPNTNLLSFPPSHSH